MDKPKEREPLSVDECRKLHPRSTIPPILKSSIPAFSGVSHTLYSRLISAEDAPDMQDFDAHGSYYGKESENRQSPGSTSH